MRKLHRWVAFISFIFVLWICLTGLMLSFDYLFPMERGAEGWWNDMQVRLWIHNQLQDMHRGSVLYGTIGHALGFVMGSALLFLSVSGSIIHIKQWQKRKKSGGSSWFWSGGDRLRTYHRFVSSAGMILFVYLTLTGVSISFVQFFDARAVAQFGSGVAPEFLGGPSAAERMKLIPQSPNTGHGPAPQSGTGAPPPPGAGAPPPPGAGAPPPPDKGPVVALSTTLQKWHKGGIAGEIGQWVIVAVGFGLIFLAVTGFLLYLRMYKAKSANGKSELFWG